MTTDFIPDDLLEDLRELAVAQERPGGTAEPAYRRMAEAGVTTWKIPVEYGGTGRTSTEMMSGYEALGAENLSAAFVLTQLNAAVSLLGASDNEALRADLLPKFASAEQFSTVGISHFSTSRQHLKKPAVTLEERDDGFAFSGMLPWCTGAGLADLVLAGGELPDGRQALAFLELDAPGVTVIPPPQLLALTPSATTSIKLDNVLVPFERVVKGPLKDVLSQRSGPTGSIGTSALAVGHAKGTLRGLAGEAGKRPDLVATLDVLESERAALSADIRTITLVPQDQRPEELNPIPIRARANSLCLRAAQSYLTASKGAGFVAGHAAGRFVRESLFFQVWSCPGPVAAAALREFSCGL
ncbi:MAG: acyl-CoA dehydrogenase family protein [Planctomycetota bacterium]